MKKTVKVEDIIRYAREEVWSYHKYMNDGKYDVARFIEGRIYACQSIIMLLAVGDCKNFYDKWEEIHKEIWGE